MKAVRIREPGSYDVLEVVERKEPRPGPDDLLVRVRAAGVNRADCMQRLGTYPIPAGVNWGDVPGLEVAGEVVETGPDVTEFSAGDRVFGLVPFGGYAEYALIDRGLALPIPENVDFVKAAGIVEAFATAGECLFTTGDLKEGETVLIHAASSGIGTTAVQMAKAAGARVLATAGSASKLERVKALGADVVINYKTEDFVEVARREAGGGVDLIIDFIGPDYLARNLDALKKKGRLVLVGMLGDNDTCDYSIAATVAKRLAIRGFTLRSQTIPEKRAIIQRIAARWMPLVASGQIGPVIHGTHPLEQAAEAHRVMEANLNTGKIILTA